MTSQPYEGERDQANHGGALPAGEEPGARASADPAVQPPGDPVAQRPGGSVPRPESAQRPEEPTSTRRSGDSAIRSSRISGTWVAVIIATILLIFLLVFILQNLTSVTVSFLGFAGNLPLGVALLFAAITGALLVALVGAARILQIRRRVRRAGSHKPAPGTASAH